MQTRQRIEYRLVREPAPEPYNKTIVNSENAVSVMRDLQDGAQEKVIVLLLNAAHRLLAFDVVHIGGEFSAYWKPSCILRAALLIGATSIIVMHNHPSGVPQPSPADEDCTKKLKVAADTLEVQLLDHIIVASDGYYSFVEHGLL